MRLTLKIENQSALPNGQPLIQVLDRQGLQMGRAADVDWQLPDPQKLISSIHAEIRYRDGTYILRDKSKNGTFLNGVRIDTPDREVSLADGDRIAIGHYELSARIEGDQAHLAPLTGGGEAPSDDIWGKHDWSAFGAAAPEPVSQENALTPIRRSGDMLEAAFEAPAALSSPASRSSSPWDSWGATSSAPPLPAAIETRAPRPHGAISSSPAPVPPSPAAAPDSDEASRALAAFLRGAGLPTNAETLRSAAAMEQAGRTLRVLVSGLFDLLKRHGEMKSVLGVERTTVRLADNNSLKFAGSADEALTRLLIPRESDLPGPAAAERSFDDVRRHEERLLTAMNDAVRHILERLSPLEIKRRETGGVMDMFIPGARKAAWWEELEREHGRLMEADGAKLDELIEDELRNAFTRHL